MLANKRVIEALRKTAYQIETDDGWNWDTPCTCNCGLFFKNLGVTEEDIKSNVAGFWTTSFVISPNRHIINKDPKSKLLNTIEKYRISLEDLAELEHVGRETIKLEESLQESITLCNYEEYKGLVCSYIRHKADELESQLFKQEQETKVKVNA